MDHPETIAEDSVMQGPSFEGVQKDVSEAFKSPAEAAEAAKDNPIPPKVDKPRPHVCRICGRSFARLEHLKRHERSHTKEKPFECPDCSRCFARRDLLLRHQQKLHAYVAPTKQKGGRRDSTSSAIGAGRARRNSAVGKQSMRPRANTISHIDGASVGMLASVQTERRRALPAKHRGSTASIGSDFGFQSLRGLEDHRGIVNGLSKINTNVSNFGIDSSLHTAPPFGSFLHDGSMDTFLLSAGPGGSTVNPAQLHFADSPHTMMVDPPRSPFSQAMAMSAIQSPEEDPNVAWIRGFKDQMTLNSANENAISRSSPSVGSSRSPGQMGEHIIDAQAAQAQESWQNSLLQDIPLMNDFNMDLVGQPLPELTCESMSPKTMAMALDDNSFPGPTSFGLQTPVQQSSMLHVRSSIDSSSATNSTQSSHRQGSVTSVGSDLVTDATRQTLLAVLSQPLLFGSYRFSQSIVSSPLSPGSLPKSRITNASLPSTADLQRYLNAYVRHFHPRLPFLHIPTLSFDALTFAGHAGSSTSFQSLNFTNPAGDAACLFLSIVSIGALFEFEHSASKDLFNHAKGLVQTYVAERRRADVHPQPDLISGGEDNGTSATAPLWLIQAMLLNVIYAHNCGDHSVVDDMREQCVSCAALAQAAGLNKQLEFRAGESFIDEAWNQQGPGSEESKWYAWKNAEERKRTLFGIFFISSMLTSTYNYPPSMTNSEIRLSLPCDEELWAADSAAAWNSLGATLPSHAGAGPGATGTVFFANALSSLLTTSQRFPFQPHTIQASSRSQDSRLSSTELPRAEFHCSAFGCLVLINALHNYIWETRRQSHMSRRWTQQETEAMLAHIGPALLAYQAIWRDDPRHTADRNVQVHGSYASGSPHSGQTSSAALLSADCIPFLDLAYVRLFVSLGKSKECFWNGDWEGMSNEITRGCDFEPHPQQTGSEANGLNGRKRGSMDHNSLENNKSSKRERHLRKAAQHAIHTLTMADRHSNSLADLPLREIRVSSTIAAMDCAHVLAEWAAAVQERVGRFLGGKVIGRDDGSSNNKNSGSSGGNSASEGMGSDGIDYESVPAIVLLEPEDVELLQRIDHFVRGVAWKLQAHVRDSGNSSSGGGSGWIIKKLPELLPQRSLSGKTLLVTAAMAERGAEWSVLRSIAKGMERQAEFMEERVDKSIKEAD